jgi:hypothetical protein
MSSDLIDSSYTTVFGVFDAIRTTSPGHSELMDIVLRFWDDGVNYSEAFLQIKTQISPTYYNWLTSTPSQPATKVPWTTPTRVWIYARAGKMVAYADDTVSSTSVNTLPRTRVGGAVGIFGIYAQIAGQSTDTELGYHVAGKLTL